MAPTREAALEFIFLQGREILGLWQHPSHLLSLKLGSVLVESDGTMGVNNSWPDGACPKVLAL